MNTSDICRAMESIAPLEAAMSWDNVGLLVGREGQGVKKLLLCIDLTETVMNEAVSNEVDMIISYHPPVFTPLIRITSDSSPLIYKAITQNIALYSPHTALDLASGGTNDILAELLELSDLRALQPAGDKQEFKVVTFVPPGDAHEVARAAFNAGAGIIGNYSNCAFMSHGMGSFKGNEQSNPTTGEAGEQESVNEVRLEMICPADKLDAVREAIKSAHEYEEPPVDVYSLRPSISKEGMGRAGRLARPVKQEDYIRNIKKKLALKHVWVAQSGDSNRLIGTVAVSAGSCGDMWKSAIDAGAGLYLTGELKHHDALAAIASGLTVVCTGHSNSERPILPILAERIQQLTPKHVDIIVSAEDRDPYEIA